MPLISPFPGEKEQPAGCLHRRCEASPDLDAYCLSPEVVRWLGWAA
jgi:hypothetical protein